jgi:alkylation response protein AidB-like acyl-CoA dehydrogenase
MDFELTNDQQELRDAVRAVLATACPPSMVRQVYESKADDGASRAAPLWRQMVQLDWPALTIPEPFGGLGLGYVELAVVVEELGRAVAPTPFVSTATQFVPMVRQAGTSEQQDTFLRPVAEAGSTGTLALAEDDGRWEAASVATTARPVGDSWVLDGKKSFVFDGATADEVAVVARQEGTSGDEGLGVFVVAQASLTSRPADVIDPSQPLAEVLLDNVAVPADRMLVAPGDPRAVETINRAIQEATAAIAIGMTGTCRAIFEITLQYAKDREQYGRPIGSFQALKHRLVDMYLAVERATSLAYFAALTIAEDDERRGLAVAMAKAAAGDCQRLVVQDGLQLHGGVGFTWEHDLHFYLKRAKSANALFGSALMQRAAIVSRLGLVLDEPAGSEAP